jgi:hypothetical protein
VILQLWYCQIDWDATGSMLSGWGTLIGAFAVIWAATRWRQQKLAERRFELAERILIATYNAQLALAHVRNAEVSTDELRRAKEKLSDYVVGWPAQSKERTMRLTKAHAYYDRLNSSIPAKNELVNCLPVARAIYGTELAEQIIELRRQFQIVQVSVETYINDAGNNPDLSAKLCRAMCDDSSQTNVENEVSAAIGNAVRKIEDFCLPSLRYDHNYGEVKLGRTESRDGK